MGTGHYVPHFLYSIHPFIAQLLSFFSSNNGKPLEQIKNEIACFFQLSIEQVTGIIQPMINNNSPLIKEFNGNKMVLPAYLLISSDKTRKETYSPNDFIIEGDIDLSTVRLYRPIHAVLELTMRCLTDCIYCYADKRGHGNDYLPTDTAIRFIKDAKKNRFVDIEINGGEVMMHPGIDSILKELAYCGYYSLISTKIPLQEDKIAFLKKIGMTRVQISLDSLNPTKTSTLLNVDKNYLSKLRQTMQLLDQYEFNWQINTVLTKHNCNIKDVQEQIIEISNYSHLKGIKFTPVGYPMYKDAHAFEDLHPSVEQISSVREYLNSVTLGKPSYWLVMADEERADNYKCKKWETFEQRSLCTANQKAFNVLPDGQVTICEELYWNPHFIIGDINQNSIMEIWNSEKAKNLFFVQNDYFSNQSNCYSCNKLRDCRLNKGVCWKMVIMAYGDEHWDYPDPRCPEAPIPYNKFYV
jgi:radical SAM protein with 4Fe4S-binding SPASM domain